MKMPDGIKIRLKREKYTVDDVGMSESRVLLFSDKVLKIQEQEDEIFREHEIMNWLKGKLPVPEVLCFEKDETYAYLLMSKLPGTMSCSPELLSRPEELISLLAEGLQRLWQVDISDCPFNNRLDEKLKKAKERVEKGLVDIEDTEPDTFSEGGFKDPEELLQWLMAHRPEEELVFSHGDFCLPNIFVSEGKLSGYLDLGRAGIADKWQDIALCYRSLVHNYDGKYAKVRVKEADPELLFKRLGISPDWEKIRYYILLDELF